MVLIQSHPALADDSPLGLLRQRRAEAEAELPRSVALSSLLFLTAVVLVLVATSILQGGRVLRWDYTPTADGALPPTHDITKYFVSNPPIQAIPDLIPPDPGVIVPVDDRLAQTDAPPIVEPAPGVEGLPGGTNTGDSNPGPGSPGGPGGGEALPAPGIFVYYEVAPVPVDKVLPDYPPIALQAGVEGTVHLLVLVGRDGHVADARVQESIPMLDDAALAATRQWTFTPAKANGHPVMVWIRLPVRFTLR